jgi:hypothetical protein
MKPGPKPEPLDQRLARMTDRTGECWEWAGSLDSDGYGQMTVSSELSSSRKLKSHRVAWILAHGPIPVGLGVLHRCDNRRCCRPDHLFLGTQIDNMRDCVSKGRHTSQRAA